MNQSNRPNKKIVLSADLFNSLYSILVFFIATEKTTGETQFSKTAARFKEQIEKYGIFKGSQHADGNTFIIYYYDREVVQIARLVILYIQLREMPTANYFAEFLEQKKSQTE